MCKSKVYQLTHPSNQVRDLRVGRSMQMIAWERKTMRFCAQFLRRRLINNNNKTDLEERSKGVRSPLVKSEVFSKSLRWKGKQIVWTRLWLMSQQPCLQHCHGWVSVECLLKTQDGMTIVKGCTLTPPGCPLLWPSSLRSGRESPLWDLYGQILGLGSSSL